MRINFGIAYNNGVDTFSPDFIVKFKNGTVGIFDTKPIDYRVDDTKIKLEALIKYIRDTNFNRGCNLKVVGGIVVKYNSVFYYYDKLEYHDFKENSEDWKTFDELLREITLTN